MRYLWGFTRFPVGGYSRNSSTGPSTRVTTEIQKTMQGHVFRKRGSTHAQHRVRLKSTCELQGINYTGRICTNVGKHLPWGQQYFGHIAFNWYSRVHRSPVLAIAKL